MEVDLWTRLASLVILMALAAGACASQAALLKLNKGRLRHLASEGVPWARSLLSMADEVSSIEASLISLLVVSLVLGAGTAADLLADNAPGGVSGPLLVMGGVLSLLWVLLASRAAGASHPDGTLVLLRWPVLISHYLLRPVVTALRGLNRRLGTVEPQPSNGAPHSGDEEFQSIVDAVEEEGPLEEGEKEMIYGIVEMGDRTVSEIMVPRVDMVAVEASEPLRVVLERITAKGHSRIPIYEETIDNIVGLVYAKDLLSYMVSGSLDEPARTLARQARYIPESKMLDELLHEMQRAKVHMVIVLDEYGGTAGLVTIEDLLEEIVGEIQDEYDVEEKAIDKVSDEEAIFDARVSIHDVNDALSLVLADGEYDTLGGLVYDRLGKIPVVGDEVHVEGACIRVLSVAGHRIKKVRVRVESPETVTEGRNGD